MLSKKMSIVGLGLIGLLGVSPIGLKIQKDYQERLVEQQARREWMFNNNYDLPSWINHSDLPKSIFIREQRYIYKRICLHGEYDPSFDGEYVDSEEASKLLRLYGWENQ